MFEFITNSENRGQVGIGTLIVFIAMVLVAAIAAGVLINTAGFLQTQAEATGQDSTDLVSERIDVSSSVGIVSSTNTEELEQVRLTVSGAPGASDIDLSDTTIQAVGPGGQENLVFAAGGTVDTAVSGPGTDKVDAPAEFEEGTSSIDVALGTFSSSGTTEHIEVENAAGDTIEQNVSTDGGTTVTVSLSGLAIAPSAGEDLTVRLQSDAAANGPTTLDTDTTAVVKTPISAVGDLSANEFAVEDNGNFQKSAVLGSQDQYTIVLNPQVGALKNTQNPNSAFGQGDSATLDLVSPAGAATQVELRAPDLFNENGEAVRL